MKNQGICKIVDLQRRTRPPRVVPIVPHALRSSTAIYFSSKKTKLATQTALKQEKMHLVSASTDVTNGQKSRCPLKSATYTRKHLMPSIT